MSSGQELTRNVQERMREDGIDLSQPLEGQGTPAQGTGEAPTPSTPPAGESNADNRGQGTPETVPYSRFAEVNGRMRDLETRWGILDEYGIEPDSAVRLASFEAAYMQDPSGTISSMVDQLDLPDSQKSAVKALLTSESAVAQTTPSNEELPPTAELPAEVKDVVTWVQEQRENQAQNESQARLDHVVGHWRSLDQNDGIQVPERQRLMYIQTAAAAGGFTTLEELAEGARKAWLEDRDTNVGGVIQRTRTGSPLAVPSGGVPPTQPVVPRTMSEARKLIEADIAAGRLPDLRGE